MGCEMTLRDPFGREVTGLRIAITARCNMSCLYCHREGEEGGVRGCEISAEEIVKVISAGASLGVKRVKITVGEPLMRGDLEEILARLPAGLEVSLTTNGTLLAGRARSLAGAGLRRVNVSLDSLRPQVYRRITGGGEDDLGRAIAGIDAALEAGLLPVKVNMVVLKENEGEVWDMVDFTRDRGAILQLIELLDGSRRGIGGDIAGIEAALGREAEDVVTRDMHRRRKYYLSGAEVEVVRPMDNTEFCAHCNRLRVTSEGRLKPCLLRNDNLVELAGADLEETKRRIEKAVGLRSPYFCGRDEKDRRN